MLEDVEQVHGVDGVVEVRVRRVGRLFRGREMGWVHRDMEMGLEQHEGEVEVAVRRYLLPTIHYALLLLGRRKCFILYVTTMFMNSEY